MSARTLVGSPEPPRPRNEPVWLSSAATTAGDSAGGGNTQWLHLDVKIIR